MQNTKDAQWLTQNETPYLLIDEDKMVENIRQLKEYLKPKKVALRPHVKTLKSLECAGLLSENKQRITVSTLAEAEAFSKAGYTDILYAVGISLQKLQRIQRIMENGTIIHILLDSLEQAGFVADYSRKHNIEFSVFIEIDCDGHRGGITPESDLLLPIASCIESSGSVITGLMTHAGESYHCLSAHDISEAAAEECRAVLVAAGRLRKAGFVCPVISVGSTPTAHHFEDLTDITEVRAGVFATFDLFMMNLGICQVDNIAISVVSTVIGHNTEKNRLFIDAGWMAMSRDRGTSGQVRDYKYGLVCTLSGVDTGLTIDGTSQEHGVITLPKDSSCKINDFPIGSKVKILPNHACATAAMHQSYEVVSKNKNESNKWVRIQGW